MRTEAYDYQLPAELIAQEAIEPRDRSRLLIASTLDEVRFSELPTLVRPGDLFVVNRTKVRNARLSTVRSDTGGVVELLLTRRRGDGRWNALARPARRLRSGVRLEIGERNVHIEGDPTEGVVIVRFEPDDELDAFIASHGEIPLPPYFTGHLDDAQRYQTMFAVSLGSSAAPTAALHFTPTLVRELIAAGVGFAEVDLEIGLDTFRPMADGEVDDHRIHSEIVRVDEAAAEAVNAAKSGGGRVIAVGTTVVRALESAAGGRGRIASFEGPTDLFIRDGFRPRAIDALITNFHAPRTTLIVLVATLLGDRWREVYGHAIAERFRFLSFGDAMFIEVSHD